MVLLSAEWSVEYDYHLVQTSSRTGVNICPDSRIAVAVPGGHTAYGFANEI